MGARGFFLRSLEGLWLKAYMVVSVGSERGLKEGLIYEY